MLISVWRHQKDQSGILLDVGVHHSDMMEYLLGDIETVYAKTDSMSPSARIPQPAVVKLDRIPAVSIVAGR